MTADSKLCVCVVWQSYGPYHHARLQALRSENPQFRVIGAQYSSNSATYQWNAKEEGVLTLEQGAVAEAISPWRIFRKLLELLRKNRVDVVMCPSFWPAASVAVAMAAKFAGCRLVLMSESHRATGYNTWFGKFAKSQLTKIFDTAFVGGTAQREYLEWLGFPAGKIWVGYDAIDNVYFQEAAAAVRLAENSWRSRLRLPPKYILNLGRLVEKKNLLLLVDAFADCVRSGQANGHSLVLVGDGPDFPQLLHRVKERGLSYDCPGQDGSVKNGQASVYFKGFAQIDVTPAYYCLASAFVLPSSLEEWGLVVNESLACGCPAIVSDAVGAGRDLVESGNRGGLVFRSGNVAELSAAIARLCNDAALCKTLGKAGSQHLAEKWSLREFGRKGGLAAGEAVDRGTTRAVDATGNEFVVLQLCMPDYRTRFFSELAGDGRVVLHCGAGHVNMAVKVDSTAYSWRKKLTNLHSVGLPLIWQRGALAAALPARLVVAEMNPWILSNWAILIGRNVLGRPMLLWGHAWSRHGRESWRNTIRRLMMRLSSGIITYTPGQAEILAKFWPRKVVMAAPNSMVRRGECRVMPEPARGIWDLICVGRLDADKKPLLMLEAYRAVKDSLPAEARLIIVGDGSQMKQMRMMAAEWGLTSVIFHGHVSKIDTLREVYAGALCSICAGFGGLNVIQSFSQGVPMIIADDEPHAPEVEACQEGFNAVYFKSNDAADLGRKILELYARRNDWIAQLELIARRMGETFCVEEMANGFRRAARSVMEKY